VAFADAAEGDAPDIDPAWDWIWAAWWRLGAGDRPYLVQGTVVPMGATLIRSEPGYIPWTAVQRWVETHGIGVEDAELLDQCVQSMDGPFREWWREE
jgi:hypothetical protein